jgi:hypothetical protein
VAFILRLRPTISDRLECMGYKVVAKLEWIQYSGEGVCAVDYRCAVWCVFVSACVISSA